MKLLFRRYFELTAWIAALVSLAFMDPSVSPHYSFCIFKNLGFKYCPGCGLGHSISYLFHGNLHASFSAHPLGVFALCVILFRIYKLVSLHIFSQSKTNYYGQ
ncbi:MAG TPA: DUF2752 domain-containing protein [Hanamia sp.]|nr:DUF2752 domain-containing protein [Hanamia sp.]